MIFQAQLYLLSRSRHLCLQCISLSVSCQPPSKRQLKLNLIHEAFLNPIGPTQLPNSNQFFRLPQPYARSPCSSRSMYQCTRLPPHQILRDRDPCQSLLQGPAHCIWPLLDLFNLSLASGPDACVWRVIQELQKPRLWAGRVTDSDFLLLLFPLLDWPTSAPPATRHLLANPSTPPWSSGHPDSCPH